jgi:adenosylhomocysteine nucleosidase
MNTQLAILSAIPAELNGFPEEEYESQILYTGVGKINATKAIMEHAMHLKSWNYSVINYGTAAKVSDNVEVGKLYEVTNFIQRDMDVTPLGFQNYETPWGNRNISFLTTTLDGICCGTGDSFYLHGEAGNKDYDIVDMESYALASVCKEYDIPFRCFKYVSDAGDPKDWQENAAKGVDLFIQKLDDITQG